MTLSIAYDKPPAMPAWLDNWIALHKKRAQWSRGRGCWIVYMSHHMNPIWEACYPDYTPERWLEIIECYHPPYGWDLT